MRSRLAICLLAMVGSALAAAPASGRIHGEYQLEFGFAKRAISKKTAALCGETAGCVNWSVKPCRRRSWHRVDCASHLYGENGVTCSFVSIAVWPPWSDHLLLRHKRVICTPPPE